MARTAALRLVAVWESDHPTRRTTLVLQNQTRKGIAAFSVSFPEIGVTNAEDCFGMTTDCVLPPENLRITRVGPPCFGSATLDCPSVPESRILSIDAVVFDDGSGDGDQSVIDAFQYQRLGLMFETERIRSILEAPNADCATIPAMLGGLPQSPDEVLASLAGVKLPGIALDRVRQADSRTLARFFGGVRSAREVAIRLIPECERQAGSPEGALALVRRVFQDLSVQYSAYCQKLYGDGK